MFHIKKNVNTPFKQANYIGISQKNSSGGRGKGAENGILTLKPNAFWTFFRFSKFNTFIFKGVKKI